MTDSPLPPNQPDHALQPPDLPGTSGGPPTGETAPVVPAVPVTASAETAVASRPGRTRRLPAIAAGLVAAIVVAGLGFAGGYTVGKGATPSPSLGAGGNGVFGNGTFGRGANGRAGGAFARGGGGATAGTITDVAPDQLTVALAAGGAKLVLVDGSTKVTKVSSTAQALTDLTRGETVTVIGTTNPDGSVTAMSIVVGEVGDLLGGLPRRSPSASAAPTAVP
ncbi:MAG: DUF5666 domain-containing protein [Candidatus Limnocylindrales bacterium]